MNRNLTLLAVLALALSLNAGCSHIIKRSLKEAKGATAKAAEVPGTLITDFSAFAAVEVSEPQNRLGGLVNSEFIHALRPMLVRQLAEEEACPFPGGHRSDATGPMLHVETDIMWYHDRGGGLAAVLGKDSFAIALFTLSDGNAEVARVQVVTKSGASRTDSPEMAEELAKGLARFIIRVRDGISEEDQAEAEKERDKRRQEREAESD